MTRLLQQDWRVAKKGPHASSYFICSRTRSYKNSCSVFKSLSTKMKRSVWIWLLQSSVLAASLSLVLMLTWTSICGFSCIFLTDLRVEALDEQAVHEHPADVDEVSKANTGFLVILWSRWQKASIMAAGMPNTSFENTVKQRKEKKKEMFISLLSPSWALKQTHYNWSVIRLQTVLENNRRHCENPTMCRVRINHLNSMWHFQIPVAMVTPGPGSASRLGALSLLLVHVQVLVFLFDVALVEYHDDPHHPGGHCASGEDDKADDDEEKVVQRAQSLVARRPQLNAHLTQTTPLHVGRGAAHRLALICHKAAQKKKPVRLLFNTFCKILKNKPLKHVILLKQRQTECNYQMVLWCLKKLSEDPSTRHRTLSCWVWM